MRAKHVLSVSLLGIVGLGAPWSLVGQTTPPIKDSSARFDVASVHPTPNAAYRTNTRLDGLGSTAPSTTLFSADTRPAAFILFAYKINNVTDARSIFDKLPEWARNTSYSIDARSSTIPTRDQLREMVRNLLEERFKLQTHYETQNRPVYKLVLMREGKPGPQLRPHPADVSCSDGVKVPASDTPSGTALEPCGLSTTRIHGLVHAKLRDVTMPELAGLLTGLSMQGGNITPHAGIDETHLTGKYDLDLEFVPVTSLDSNNDADGLQFAKALEKQGGLRLEESNSNIPVLVLDHIEQPEAN